MAKYTIELRTIIESGIPIFDFPYAFYDESKRKEFESKFIKHFYFREIGCETVERFKWYLEDKMNVVFPFYNELFRTAQIEYDKINNYNITETFTKTSESESKGGGVSSTVGRTKNEQTTETDENRTVDTVGNVDTVGSDTDNETASSTTNTTDTSNTVNAETVDGTTTKNSESSATNTNQNVKKYLDTPQGLTDLTDSKYLTNLTQDNGNSTQETDGKETTTENRETNGTNETESTGTAGTESERNATKNTLVNTDTTGKETTDGKIKTSLNNEQIGTQDNNTRTYATGERTENYTLSRVGNIGVQTGADILRKHIRLQEELSKIEKMFFAQCEDLFMLVF